MVSTEIKYASFRSVSHQMQLPTPTASSQAIYQAACKLFEELWNGEPIRLLGVRTSKLASETEPVQLNLFDYGAPAIGSAGKPHRTGTDSSAWTRPWTGFAANTARTL
jgi:hypothetical protein